ncbi:MAG: ABC transporter ATP-binding protein [Halobacteriaceae archaeon]
MRHLRTTVEWLRPHPTTLLWLGPLLLVEAIAVLAYAARPTVHVTNPVYLLVPFVWIDVGVWAAARAPLPASWTDDGTGLGPASGPSRRLVAVAGAIGVGYFLVLAWVSGVFAVAPPPEYVPAGLRVTMRLPPGFAPVVHYVGGGMVVTGFLYELVGYAALAYLVAVRVLEASGAALSGVLALFSCVSCTWPVLGSLAAAAFGTTSAVAAFATNEALLVSTAVYLSAVALLSWRPSWR